MQLDTENYITLLTEIKEDSNKWCIHCIHESEDSILLRCQLSNTLALS